MLATAEQGSEAVVGSEGRAAGRATGRAAESGPLGVAADRDGEPAFADCRAVGVGSAALAVAAAVDAVWGHPGGSVALADLVAAVGGVVEQGWAHRGGDRLELSELDALAVAGASAVAQRGEDREHGVAGVDHVVGVVGADPDRSALRFAGEVRDAGDGGEHGAEAEEVAVRSERALHRLVGGDDLRVDGAELLVGEAPALDHARGEVGEEDVGALDQAERHIARALGGHVEQERGLTGVVVVEVCPDVVAGFAGLLGLGQAQAVDAGFALDADHLRAKVGEGASGDRAGAEPGEVGDADAVERASGWLVISRPPRRRC